MTAPYRFPKADRLLTRKRGAAYLRKHGYLLASQMLADGEAGPRFVAHNDGEMLFEWGDLMRWTLGDPEVQFRKEMIEQARRMGWDAPPTEDSDAITAATNASFAASGGFSSGGISWQGRGDGGHAPLVNHVWGDDSSPQAPATTAESATATAA
jgi:hypothetical protein